MYCIFNYLGFVVIKKVFCMVASLKTEFYMLYVLLEYISHVLKEKQVCIIPTR